MHWFKKLRHRFKWKSPVATEYGHTRCEEQESLSITDSASRNGHDTVSALLQNAAPVRSSYSSRARAKEQYAAELRAQMAEQLGNKQLELNTYHSRPAAQRGRALSPERLIPAEPERFAPVLDEARFGFSAHPTREAYLPPHPAPGPPAGQPPGPPAHQQPLSSMQETHQPSQHQMLHQIGPGQPQYHPPDHPSHFHPPLEDFSPPRHEYVQKPSHQYYSNQMQQHPALPPMPDYPMPPDYSPPKFDPPPPMPHRDQINHLPPDLHMYEQMMPSQPPVVPPEHYRTADLWAQQRGPPSAGNTGILAFLRTESKQEGRKAEKAAAYRAELQAQMQQAQETRRKQKEEEREQDKKMLDAFRNSPPNRYIYGQGSPNPPPAATTQNIGGMHFTGDMSGPMVTTAHPPAMAALGGAVGGTHSTFRHTQDEKHFMNSSLQENDCSAGNRQPDAAYHRSYGVSGGGPMGASSSFQQPAAAAAPTAPSAIAIAAAHGGVVPRGLLVNAESSLADTPTLHFKSDKAFLTAAELASRNAAATDLQASLQAQIAEKKARKDAEERAERERDAAEMRKLQKEQEELARKQKEDLERERKPNDNATAAQDQVAEAWRKAQQEAAPRRGRHSGRHGSPSRGVSTGGGAPSQAAIAGLRESRSRSKSPGRDGGARAPMFSDRDPGDYTGAHARVGFADPHTADHDRHYDQQPSGHQRSMNGGQGGAVRPLSGRFPGSLPPHLGNEAVSHKLDQIRAEMYTDNDRLRSELAARNADIKSLLERAAQYEQQSLVAKEELETIRLRMNAAEITRTELEPLPDAPMRFDHVPGQTRFAPHPSELHADSKIMAANVQRTPPIIHPTREHGFLPDLHPNRSLLEESGPNRLPATISSGYPAGASATYHPPHAESRRVRAQVDKAPAHPTLQSGFLSDMPPTAARQKALAIDTATPKRRAALCEDQEEPLVAHTQFIPLPGARQPTTRDPDSSHHHAPVHSPIRSATGELHATSATLATPWLSPSRIPAGPQASPASRFERVKIPPKHRAAEGPHVLDASRIPADTKGHGLTNPPIFIDLAKGAALDEGDVLPADSSFLDEGGLHMMNSDRLAMLEGLRLQGDVKSSVEVLDAFLDGFVNQGSSSMPLYSSVNALPRTPLTVNDMHAAQKALEASEKHSRQQFAMRPSEMSVQGMSLQQVNDTSTAALNTMAEAEALLGAVSVPQLPQEGPIGSSRHIEASNTHQSSHHSDPRPTTRGHTPQHADDDAPALASELNGSAAHSHNKDATVGGEHPHTNSQASKAKSRYDTDLSENDGETSAPSSDGEADELDEATMASLKQGIDAVQVRESVDRQKVGMSVETLESVDLAGSDGHSNYSEGDSDDDQASP